MHRYGLTNSTRPVGPPITRHTLMRTDEPTVGGRITRTWPPTMRTIVRPVRNDESMITACAAETPDEPPKTPRNAGGGTTPEHVSLCVRPIHLLRRTGVTISAVSQGATGKTLRRVSKATAARGMTSHKAATARAVMKYEPAIQCIRILRCRVHAMRPGTRIVHLWAQIAVADPPQCRCK